VLDHDEHQVLLGVTGAGKTYTITSVGRLTSAMTLAMV